MRALLVLVVASLAASEEGKAPLELKIAVKGMSCPDGCAPLIVKGLNTLENVREAKLVDFKKGLFSLKVNSAKKVSPLALQDAIGTDYVLGKIETKLAGTVSKGKRGLSLTTASGVRYGLVEGKTKCDEKACGKTLDRIGAWLKEGKTNIRVAGDFDEFCPGKVVLNVHSAESISDETTKN